MRTVNLLSQTYRRMKFSQYTNEVFLGDMRVALRRSNRGVTEEFLHHPDIRSISEKHRCNGVPQHMRRHVPFHSGLSPQLGK